MQQQLKKDILSRLKSETRIIGCDLQIYDEKSWQIQSKHYTAPSILEHHCLSSKLASVLFAKNPDTPEKYFQLTKNEFRKNEHHYEFMKPTRHNNSEKKAIITLTRGLITTCFIIIDIYPCDYCFIEFLGTRFDCRGKGYAKFLLRCAILYLKYSLARSEITLISTKESTMFYTKLGFDRESNDSPVFTFDSSNISPNSAGWDLVKPYHRWDI